MRRRVLTILGVLALLAALGLVEHLSVHSLTDEALNRTREILSDVRADALDAALQKARALDQLWDERAVRLEMMVDHKSTDDVRYALSRLIGALECGDRTSAMIYAGELEGGIEHVSERQELSVQNIL